MNVLNQTARVRGIVMAMAIGCSPAALAVNFLVDGEVTTCAALACGAAGIAVGDPISGFVGVDDAAAGPNSTITQNDVTEFSLTVGDVTAAGDSAALGSANLMTDGDGEIASGSAEFETTVDTGFGIADVIIVLDAATGTWEASTDFIGLGTFATGTLTFMREMITDSDNDGIADAQDNCIEIANPAQRDTDGDLFGNACDADLNNDNIINVVDLGILRAVFFSADPDADFNGDGTVNVSDLGILRTQFFGMPGPSGLVP